MDMTNATTLGKVKIVMLKGETGAKGADGNFTESSMRTFMSTYGIPTLVANSQWTVLTNGEDLNTITGIGIYVTPNSTVSQSLLNSPTTGIFKMIVENSTNDVRYIHQTITVAGAGTSNLIYKRASNDGGSTWNEWRETSGATRIITDFNDAIIAGFYNYDASASNRPPFASGGSLAVFRHDANYTYQIAGVNSSIARPRLFVRKQYNGTWSEWFDIANEEYRADAMTAIPADSDLNDYTVGGMFKCTSGTTSSSIANNPCSGRAFILKVIYLEAGYILQEMRDYSNNIYERRIGSTNTSWVKLATTSV